MASPPARVASAPLGENSSEHAVASFVDLLFRNASSILHGQKTTNRHDWRWPSPYASPAPWRRYPPREECRSPQRLLARPWVKTYTADRTGDARMCWIISCMETLSPRACHGDQNKRRMTARRVGKTFINVGGQEGSTTPRDAAQERVDRRVLVRRDRRHQQENCAGTQRHRGEREITANRFAWREGSASSLEPTLMRHLSWFFSLGLEFCKRSRNCLAQHSSAPASALSRLLLARDPASFCSR